MKKNKMIKILSATLATATIISTTVTPNQVYANTNENITNEVSENATTKTNNIDKEKFQQYVNIENNKFKLNENIFKDSSISIEMINALQENLNNFNTLIETNNIKDVSIDTKIEFTVDNQEIAKTLKEAGHDIDVKEVRAGVNRISFYWWGFELRLDSYMVQKGVDIGSDFLATAITMAFPTVVGAVAGVIAREVVRAYWQNSKVYHRGIVVDYNTHLHRVTGWYAQ